MRERVRERKRVIQKGGRVKERWMNEGETEREGRRGKKRKVIERR